MAEKKLKVITVEAETHTQMKKQAKAAGMTDKGYIQFLLNTYASDKKR